MIPFAKMQAVGNDFIVVAAEAVAGVDLPGLALRVCDRHYGIGADGLLVFTPGTPLGFRIFNADGSEDTMCGNGLRCVVRWAVDRGAAPPMGTAQTRAGAIAYTTTDGLVTLTLPPPQFWDESVAGGTTVDTGSLHTVLWSERLPDNTTFFRDSPRIETNPLFPERTSVMWAVVAAPDRLQLRIWERGVGETLGCGTGACAAAVAALQTGRVPRETPLTVVSLGGELKVQWGGLPTEPVLLTGPATLVFSGTIS